jgi:cytochrome oxidase Cu insertion factor (SCO1/SenC/PrrC family)
MRRHLTNAVLLAPRCTMAMVAALEGSCWSKRWFTTAPGTPASSSDGASSSGSGKKDKADSNGEGPSTTAGKSGRASTFRGFVSGLCTLPLSWYAMQHLLDDQNSNDGPNATGGGAAAAAAEAPGSASPAHRPSLGGPFELVDAASGALATDRDVFGGKWTLLYFGFAKCAEICPRNLAFLTSVLAAARLKYGADANCRDGLAQLQGCFLSIDHIRDNPAAVQKFLAPYDPKIRGLCGNRAQVQQAASAWRVYFSSYDESDEEKAAREAKGVELPELAETYQFDHSSAIYLVGPDGKLKDFFFLELGVATLVDRLALHFVNAYDIN